MMSTRACAALIALLLVACSGGPQQSGPPPRGPAGVGIEATGDQTDTTVRGLAPTAAPAATPQGPVVEDGWRPITPPPLSVRDGAAVAWTGEELLIVGGRGQAPCDPVGPCAAEDLTDGAAYDPVTDVWRPIADLPLPAPGAQGIGTRGGAVVGSPGQTLWRYVAATDTWHRLNRIRDGLDGLAVAGDRMVAYASTQEVLGPPDHVRDRITGRWRPLPPDPLGLTRDRRMVWVGDGLVLLGVPIDPQLTDPPLVRAARLEDPLDDDPRWQPLPDSVTLPGGDWVATTLGVVNPQPVPPQLEQAQDQQTQGGQTQDLTRGRPHGGVLQLDPPAWFDLPMLPEDLEPPIAIDVPPSAGGRTVVAGGYALDLATGTWTVIPDDPALPTHGRITAWAGDRVLVWGGPQDTAMVWLPPWASLPVPDDVPDLDPQRPLEEADPIPTPGPGGHPDGRIDCLDEARTRLTDLSAGAERGVGSAEQALRMHLQPQADHDEGHVVMVGDIHASVVVGYREMLNATALQQSDGRWVVGLMTACGDVDLVIN